MTQSAYDRCLAIAWEPSNDGQPLHLTTGDPNPTAWGVIFSNFVAWRLQHGLARPSLTDFSHATQAELSSIIRAWIWNAVQGDEMAEGLNLVVFEAAFMSGPGHAVRPLQTVLGVTDDGDLGAETMAALRGAHDVCDLIQRYVSGYMAYVNGIETAPRFAGGWDRRITDDQRTALGWAGGTAPVVAVAAADSGDPVGDAITERLNQAEVDLPG